MLASGDRVRVAREDLALELLPLCHVFERMFGYCYMYREVTKAYCSVHHVGELISEIKPTVFAAVPRLYEKIYDHAEGHRQGGGGPGGQTGALQMGGRDRRPGLPPEPGGQKGPGGPRGPARRRRKHWRVLSV